MNKPFEQPFHRLDDAIDAALLERRRLFICGSVDMEMAGDVIKKIWYLDHISPQDEVVIIINSQGGAVDAGFAIWDQLKMASFPKTTVVTGLAASMGSVLALAAPKERRFASPMSRFMIHQPALSSTVQGQATDLEIQAKEILRTKQQIVALYCAATGRGEKEVEKAIDRDKWMTAEEAESFGLINKTVNSYKGL